MQAEGRTDRQDDANTRISQVCQRAYEVYITSAQFIYVLRVNPSKH
jgi:hypothetical protein